jgi:hypothetical protein
MEKIVACTLSTDQMSERRQRWHALAGGAFVGRNETERGLRLVFRNGDGVLDELRELAELERDCCAFAHWTVGVADGRAVLEVAGTSDEGIAAVHAMFRALS